MVIPRSNSFGAFFRKTIVLALVVAFGLTAFQVFAAEALQGDYTCDGKVDLDDYVARVKVNDVNYDLLIGNWGKSGQPGTGCQTAGGSGTGGTTTPPTSTGSGATTPPAATGSGTTTAAIKLDDPKLVAYMTMEEASGALLNKKTGATGTNLIPQPNATILYQQAGVKGKAVKVNGVAHAFCSSTNGTACANVEAYDYEGPYTMGMWVKFDSFKGFLFRKWELEKGIYSFYILDSNIFLGALAHPHPDYLFGYDHGIRENQPTGRSYVEGYMTLKVNEWQHIVLVRDTQQKTVLLYINGVKQDTHPGTIEEADGDEVISTMRNDNRDSNDPFRLGELKGTIDEFFAYDKALTAQEVKAIYDGSKP